MKMIVKQVSFFLCICIIGITFAGLRVRAVELAIEADGAILMEASTGKILYEKNADVALPPASVTKTMSLLLIFEAMNKGNFTLDDMVQVSENAASMGGSQVFLAAGETMRVEDLIKSIVIASANDATVAMAEFVAGSEEGFVEMMNTRAKELGMENTTFINTNGLDDNGSNMISARDVAIVSRELIKHEKILEYSSTWMDTIRDGAFTLSNTNRLIRFYQGANGLKTGSTSKAKFCVSATALRDGLQLIAVVMGAPTKDARNESAKKLLDYGFATYANVKYEACELDPIEILGGISDVCRIGYGEFSAVVSKGDVKNITYSIEIPENCNAPLKEGDKVGEVIYSCNGEEIGRVDVMALETVERIGFWGLFEKLFKSFIIL